jgi:hypothetical protein
MATYLQIARVIKNQNAIDRISAALLVTSAAVQASSPITLQDLKNLALSFKVATRLGEIAEAIMPFVMLDATLQGLSANLIADVGVLSGGDETTLETNIQRVVDAKFPVLAEKIISGRQAQEALS